MDCVDKEKRDDSVECGSGNNEDDRNLLSELEKLRKELDIYKKENEVLKKNQAGQLEGSVIIGSTDLGIASLNSEDFVSNGTVRMGLNEIKNIIPEFNPTNRDSPSVSSWLKFIENMKSIYKWDQISTLMYATLRLGGAASMWYNGNHHKIADWENFKINIAKSFPEVENNTTTLIKIMNRRRQHNECIEQYFYEITALASKIELPEASTIQYIIAGLNNEHLSNSLITADCQNIQDLLLKIKRYEEFKLQEKQRMILQDNRRGFLERRAFKRPFAETLVNTSGASKGKQVNINHNSNKKPRILVKCYKCGQSGHYANSCKDKGMEKRCFKCDQVGHVAKNCSSSQVHRIQTQLHQAKDEYHKEIEIDGKVIIAFVDLGSECTTMQISCVRNFNWEIMPCNTQLQGFGGNSVTAIGKVQKLIKYKEIAIEIEIIVVEDEWQSVSVILGRDFLDRPNIRIVKEWRKLNIVKTETDKQIERRNNNLTPISRDEINIEEIEGSDCEKLMELLSTYRDCFAKNSKEVGKTDLIHMEIKLKKPDVINYRPYKVAYGLKGILKETINELLENDIIQLSTSEYASPVLFVPKSDGTYRMCVDFRKINAITEREHFPLPNIEETLNSLAGKAVFTSLDLFSGYHQIPIEAGSRKYTAFVTPEGHYEYKRVPFGLTNSPAVFLRLMNKVLGEIKSDQIVVYMDDILIATNTTEENIQVLTKVLKRLRKAGLTIKVEKCSFMQHSINFLGHHITKEGIQPGITKTTAVEKFERPKSASDIRRFIGLTSYFRRFIKNYAHIAAPLHKLTKKNSEFIWSDHCEEAFQRLKTALISRPILTLFDPSKEHEVHTDASSVGIAGILFQKEGKELYSVAYFSRITTAYEEKYHSYELETLAVVESVERFRHYLLLKTFKIVTDCTSLKATQEKRNIVPRIARWWLKLSEYEFTMEHRAGTQLQHVDALSRCPTEDAKESETVAAKIMKISAQDEDWVATLQMQDERIKEIKGVLNGENREHPEKDSFKCSYIVKNNRLYKKTEKGEKFVVPKALRWRIIKMAHDEATHCGLTRTIENIQRYFWFPSMRRITKKYLNSCIDCLYYNRGNDANKYKLQTPTRVAIPFHTVHVDHLGPFPKSKGGKIHLVGVIDSFTKFIFLKPVKAANSKGVLDTLNEITQFVGMPSRIISDRGTAFTSKEFGQYCEENEVKHILTTVQTPRGNGQIERYFRTIKTAIATLSKAEDGSDWDKTIRQIQWSLNSAKHTTTQKSPQELLFDFRPRNILGNKLLLALQNEEDEDEDNIPLSDLRERVLERIRKSQEQQADKFNQNRRVPHEYSEGDLVLIRNEAPATGTSRKIQPRFKGPYQVAQVLGNDRYLIRDPDTGLVTQKPYNAVHSAERMKGWCELREMDLLSEDDLSDSIE